MKNTRTGQSTIRKLLKGAGSAILLATLFVLVFAGTLSGAFGVEENLQQNGIIESNVANAANSYHGDYISSGLTVNNGPVGAEIENIYHSHTDKDGGKYFYYRLSSNVGWEGKNKVYYYGWYVSFKGRAYYAITNGAVSTVHNKISLTGDGSADGKKYHIHSDKPSTNGDTTLVSNGGTFFNLSAEKKASNLLDHSFTADLGLTSSLLTQYGLKEVQNGSKVITYYQELGLFGGSNFSSWPYSGDVDTYSDDGVWLDIYISDDVAPTITHTNGSTSFTFKDATAGIYKIYASRNGGAESEITPDTITDDTKTATWTADKGGVYKFRVIDNVGNTLEQYEYVQMYGTKTSSPFELTCREDFETLSWAINGRGDNMYDHTWVSDGFAGSVFNVVPSNDNGQGSAKYGLAANTYINMLGTAFTPIGYYTDKNHAPEFKGTINGNNCSLVDFIVNATSARSALVGTLAGNGKISNLTIGNANESKKSSVTSTKNDSAAFVGYLNGKNTVVEGCTSYATISGAAQNGGIVANISTNGGKISNCKNYGNVSGTSSIGGIVGIVQSANGIIENCENNSLNNSKISGSGDNIGGIAGYLKNGTIASGKNSSNVTGGNYVGGLAGWAQDTNISSSENSASLISGSDYVGGLTGFSFGESISTSVNKGTKVTGANYVGGISGRKDWGSITGVAGTVTNTAEVAGTGNYVGGIVGEITSYSAVSVVSNSGKVSGVNCVGGIIGRRIRLSDENLIQYESDASCAINGFVNSCEVSGTNYVGGIIGYTNAPTNFTNCSNQNSVSGTNYVGGIIGCVANKTTITNSANNASVSGSQYVGGLVGGLDAGLLTITKSSNQYGISGTKFVGGVLGGVIASQASDNCAIAISECYNTQNVTATGNVAGIFGGVLNDNEYVTITISKSYNTGEIKSTGSGNAGGIAGRAYSKYHDDKSIHIYKCYNTGKVHDTGANGDSVGGIVGYVYMDDNKGQDANAEAVVVEYCYNYAEISASKLAGGIVGSGSTTGYFTIRYCYTTIDDDHNVTGGGAILGGVFNGDDSSHFVVQNSWAFYTGNYVNLVNGHNTGAGVYGAYLLVEFQKNVYPVIGTTNDDDWTKIVNNNIESFYIEGGISVENGYYLALLKENKGADANVEKYFAQPSNLGDLTINANTDGSTSFGVIVFSATTTTSAWNIRVSSEDIGHLTPPDLEYVAGHNPEYNNEGKSAHYKWDNDAIRNGYYGFFQLFRGDDVNVTENGYYFDVQIRTDETVVGENGEEYKDKIFGQRLNIKGEDIVKRKLKVSFKLRYNTSLANGNIFRNDAFGLESLTISRLLGDNSVLTLEYTYENDKLVFTYKYTSGDKTETVFTAVGTFSATNIGEYTYTITIGSSNYEFEDATGDGITVNTSNEKSWSYKIIPYDLASHFKDGKVWFGANTQMIVTNNVLTEIKQPDDTVVGSYYPLNKTQGETPQALIYEKVNYSKNSFIIYVQYSNDKIEAITLDTNYTLSDLATAGSDHVNTGASVTATAVANSNFSNSITKYYVVLDSDFGWSKNDTSNRCWGTKDNPYIISTQAQLMRLSQILNGDNAWNSIDDGLPIGESGIVLAADHRAFATDKTYSGAYFVVTADIHLDDTFKPIGNNGVIFKAASFASDKLDENGNVSLVTINYYYNQYDTDPSYYEERDYVGLFGNVEGTHFKDLYVRGASYDGTSYTGRRVIGNNYVGGLVGHIKGGIIENCTFTSNYATTNENYYGYNVCIVGQNYVGGLVGYAEGTQIIYDTSNSNMDSSDNIVNARIAGVNYVGGIVGKWDITNAAQFNNGNDLYFSASGANIIVVSTGSYAGAIAGELDASNCAEKFDLNARLYYKSGMTDPHLKAQVVGTNYVGALYGSFIGGGTDKTTLTYASGYLYATVQFGKQDDDGDSRGRVIGGFIGYLQDATLAFANDYTVNNTTIVFSSTGVTNLQPSFFGGIIGVLGKGANIVNGTAIDGGNKSSVTLKNDLAFGTSSVPYGDFVGGIIGYVSSGAGRANMGSTIFGDDLIFVGNGALRAGSYVGGIIGAIGIIDNYTVSGDDRLTNTIKYGSTTNVANANIVTFKPSSAKNVAAVYGASNVGGLIGGVFKKALLYLENSQVTGAGTVDNPTFAIFNKAIVSGDKHVGGIVGYLEQESHVLNRIVNIGNSSNAYIGKADASYVGGLVGYMIGGTISNSAAAAQTSPEVTSNIYLGSKYVGGLVGFMQGGSLENSLSTGFKFDGNNTSLTKGGVVGDKLSPIIEGSWTIYIATDPTYSTVSDNKNGKYILIDESVVREVGTFAHLLAMAGVCNATTYNDYAFNQGELLIGVDYPTKSDFGQDDDQKQPQQLAFYDVSGSDSVMKTPTTKLNSDGTEVNIKGSMYEVGGVVHIGVSMADGDSYSVCNYNVKFSNIKKFFADNNADGTNPEGRKNAEEGYLAPSGAKDRYRVEVISAQYTTAKNNDNGGDIERIIANIYFNDVLIASVESVVGNYDSGKLTPGDSETTAYTISTQAEWNDFAWNIYTGQNDYKNKYIKLLTDITIEKKATHTGTNNASYNFNNTTTPNSSSSDSKNATSNLGYNIAGNIAQGADDSLSIITVTDVSYTGITKVTPSFKGRFDGNGHTITIKFTEQAHRVSVFPNASVDDKTVNTTFKNLTIDGYIIATDGRTSGSGTHSTAGYDIAGFVGKPFGKLSFYNCVNLANITGLRNVAGILGYNARGFETTLETCVNEGNITSLEGSFTLGGETQNNTKYSYDDGWGNKAYPYGTGGIIGGVTGNLTIQSCRNTGNVTGGHNVGGIIGYSDGTGSGSGIKTLIIDSCANSGKVLANSGNWNADQGGLDGDDSRGTRMNIFGYAGGIVGRTGEYSLLRMYASYNSGEIITYSNIAGGLVGGVGYMGQGSGKKNTVVTPGKSVIAYCYNTGVVKAGGTFPKDTENWGPGERENHGGDMVGGIAGLVGDILITDCYNIGDVYAFGITGYGGSWQLRAGGIAGQADPTSNTKSVLYNRCYNVGNIYSIHIRSWYNLFNSGRDLRYGAPISGYCDDENGSSGRITATDCYSLTMRLNVRPAKRDQDLSVYQNYNSSSCEYFDTRKENWLKSGSASEDYVKTGDLCETSDKLSSVMNANGNIAVSGAGWKTGNDYNSFNGSDTTFNFTASYESIDAALSNKGTSASDYPSGWIFVYGCMPQLAVFAVDTYNGLSMRSVNYGLDVYGTYQREIAGEEYSPFVIKDGIDLLGLQTLVDMGYSFEGKYVEFADGTNNLDETASKVINMPTDNGSTAYKYYDGTSYSGGKSYHLFSRGAASDYTNWQNANYRYTAGDALTVGATFANQNFIAIGRNGVFKSFKGHISGAQTDGSVTEVANLRIVNKEVAGLFGYVQNAEVHSVGASGTVTAYANGTDSNSRSVAGGIVAVAYGSSIIDGCEAGSQNRPLYVCAYGKTDSYNESNTRNITTSAGGIVGLANTARNTMYFDGTTLTVSNNKVVNAKVQSAKNDIGGIVGFASGTYSDNNTAKGKNNRVEIVSNVVEKAEIGALSASGCTLDAVGTKTGGIIGYSDKNVAIIVRECVVGTDSATNTVTIQGENRVGGIMGETLDAVNEISGCQVLASTTISRGNSWGVVTNAGEGGTAIGGIVGLTYNATGTDPVTTTFSGNIVFKGKIVVAVQTNYDATKTTTEDKRSNDGVVRNVGGIVGDMGSGARIATGSNIEVGGTIQISAAVDNDKYFNRNIGGVAGRTDDVAFSGTFKVAPTITASDAYQIGGFIGKNNGIVNILADDTDIEIGGNISASHDVGGFIGYNNAASTLLIGADQYRAVSYDGDLSIKIVKSVGTTATLIKASGDNVGGIVGNSEVGGEVKIVKGTIVNAGQVAGANNIGGIIGYSDGTLSTGGSIYDTTLEITNEGKVTGSGDFVGGVIGKLNNGQIAGKFVNKGNVTGRDYVGGSIGYVAKAAQIISTGGSKTEFTNEAVAILSRYDALVAADDTIADDSKFNVKGRNYVGGSIGMLFGWSIGNEDYKVVFTSKGTVDGDKYVGGSIGVLAGRTEYTDFISEGEMTNVSATTAVGGSVGFIGVPNPLVEDKTVTEAYIKVTHTHFEANGTLQLIKATETPAEKDEYVWGGIGGAIGAIGNADDNLFNNPDPDPKNNRWTDNTYYASGNVTAEGYYHVGGIVGLIKADNITIANMLAYDTKVTGGKNVGGIVGATTGANTVINSAYSISTKAGGGIFTAPQGNAGGIIGLAQDDTNAGTSYWVKGYTNAELAGSSVTNLKTTLGRYTLAYEVYTLDGKEVTVVFTKELIGTGTTTGEEGGETGDEEVAIYPTPYAYYESVGTHKATNGTTYTINEEEVTEDNKYVLIKEDLTWQAYFDATFGTDKDGKSKITYQKDVGAWVEETSNWKEYSTGTQQTGWYFVYANDQSGEGSSIGTISAVHTTSTADGYSDLWYWKRIANAYTMSERNAGYDDDTKANSPYLTNPLSSAIVREITKGETAADDTVSTVPHNGTLYATATAADFKNNASASGYYMYIASSGSTKPTSVYYKAEGDANGKFFIQAEGGVSQNVAVYYRSIAMGSALTYNGYERYAPISLSGDIEYSATIKTDENNKNKYLYNTINKDTTVTPRIPKSEPYYTTVNVYYFDDAGEPYIVGGIKDGAWKINQRKLTFSATDVNGKVYGDEDIETTITITDIALADMNNIEFTLTIEGLSTPITIDLKNGAKFDENQGVTFSAVTVFQTSEVKLKGNDTKYIIRSLSTNDRETGKLTFNIKFKNAKNYKLSVGLKSTEPSKYYTLQDAKKEINVEKKELDIKLVNGTKAVVFDNQTHGISWEVTGFVYGENLNDIASLSPKIYADVDGDTNVYTTSLIANGVFAKSIGINTSSSGRTSSIGVEVTPETNFIKLTGAKLKGEYYLAFDKREADDCNYKFKTDNDKVSDKLIISDNMLTVKWGSETGHEYNREVGTITATVTAKDQINNLADFVKEYFVITGEVDVADYSTITDKTVVKITFKTKSYNADTYKVTLNKSDKILEIDCNFTIQDKVNTKTYEITPLELKFTHTMLDGKNSFVYNSYHQGLMSVTVTNILDKDTVWLGIKITGKTAITIAQKGKTSTDKTITITNDKKYTKGTIDVGSYSANVTLGSTDASKNYKLPTNCNYSWEITKKSLKISGLAAQNVTYDGQAHRPSPKLDGADSGKDGVYTLGQDTIEINYTSGELSKQSFVNAETYTISINTNQKVVAKRGNVDASGNYDTTIEGSNKTTFTIKPREINLAWTSNAFVYDKNKTVGQTIASVTADDNTSFRRISSSTTAAAFYGYAGKDTITFTVSGAQRDAGTWQMKASIDSVTGTNADGTTESNIKNYKLIESSRSCEYTIDQLKVSVKYSSGRIADKVYDATNVVKDLSGLTFAISSSNGTYRPSFSDVYRVTSAYYKSSDVGDWQLTLTYEFIGGVNYIQEGDLSETTASAVGTITPATITIKLDRLRNGRATRTFAEGSNGINVYYGGANGAVNGQRNNRSATYRLGEGFTISGFPSAETDGVVKVLAKYVEVGDNRALFDGYVNYIYDDGSGFVKGTATSDYVVRYNLYKALEFSIKDATSAQKAQNYNFKVVDDSKNSITGDSEAQLGTADKSLRVYDQNDQNNENVGGQKITIEITVKTYKIKYGNTTQSYANSDGSYNTKWEEVKAIDLPTGIQVEVKNGWMTENGQPDGTPKIYKQYTVIRGRANSTELSASVTGTNGKQLNYNMTNQPVLTIGYFVEENNDVFEIGSLSSLLIASYYWWVSANSGNLEFNQVINTTVTWNTLISDVEYENNATFVIPSGAPVPPEDANVTTWDGYFVWLESQGITVFLNENENNTWGYYTTTTGAGEVKKYSSFKQIRDINGTFTQSDIEMLDGFFQVYDVENDKYIAKKWGYGGDGFITNFLKVGVGNVAVAIGSIFQSIKDKTTNEYVGFTGAYDGGGYVIEYFNIMSFDGAENVGMFDVLGITANVKNLHLRNFTINANAGNVGGIAGKALAGENVIENVSWHGTISMSGSGNVGGLMGLSARPINKAIALGTINAKGGNIGGLIGSIAQDATITISNAVSFVYIDATGNVGAVSASSSGATATNVFYLANSAWSRSSGTLAVSNGTYGTAKTYTELMNGSISGYSVSGKEYYRYADTKLGGDFDMLDDFSYGTQTAENVQNMNARQSLRLKDIVDVYMLMYDIKETSVTVDSKTIKVYTISSTSWLVGDKHGTDGDEIVISNRQQVALLRELRFASFILTSDVVATTTSSSEYAYSGAFFGNVTVEKDKSYTIDFGLGKRAFEALASGSSVPYKQNA